MAKSFIDLEQDQARRIRAIHCIQIEIGRMERNYPPDAPEHDVFRRVARFLKILHKIHTEDC